MEITDLSRTSISEQDDNNRFSSMENSDEDPDVEVLSSARFCHPPEICHPRHKPVLPTTPNQTFDRYYHVLNVESRF